MSVADTAHLGLQKVQSVMTARETILLISPELTLTPLETLLQQNGIETVVFNDAVKAFAQVRCHAPTVILLDRSCMHYKVLKCFTELRSIAIVFFCAPGAQCDEEDCIKALDDGAAAVICNGTYREIVARVRALLRRERCQYRCGQIYNAGCVNMDMERHEVKVDEVVVDLTNKEFLLLQAFLEWPGRVLSRQELLDRIWGRDYALDEHALDVHIHNLRRKIESKISPQLIMTIRGVGYKLCESRGNQPAR